MVEISMAMFRGLTIMLLTIIAYMLLDSILKISSVTFILCAASGIITIFACKDISREELKMFRMTLALGAVFFMFGNWIILTNMDKAYYDTTVLYIVTLGFFLTAVGMIVMFSSTPIIIYKDVIREQEKRKTKTIMPPLPA